MNPTPTTASRPQSNWNHAADRPEVMVEQMRHLVGRNAGRWKRLLLLEAVGLAVAIPLAYLWAIFLLDNAIHLPSWGRVLAMMGLVVAVVLPGIRLVRRLGALALTEDEVALAIERQTPGGVQNRLINALQLTRGGATGLAPAVVRENYDTLRHTTLPTAIPSGPALIRGGVAAVLVGLGVLFWAVWPDHFSNAAGRILLPFADIEPIYRTQLEVDPGDIEAEGDVTIRIRIQGNHPDQLIVTRQVQGQRLRESINVPEDVDEVSYTFVAVRQSLTYTVQGGDYTTRVFRIDVPTSVRLSLVRAIYHHPTYTGKSATTIERAGGDLEALRGTRAELTFVLDHPVDQAAMIVERLAPKDADDRTVTQKIELTAQSGTEYRGEILFEDALSYELEVRRGEREPERLGPFAIRVLTDQNPKLELSGIDHQSELSVDATVPLRIRATDDVGLEKVGMFVRRAGDANWRDIVIWQAERAAEFTRTYELNLASLAVTEGDSLELALRAVDTDPLKRGEWVTGSPQKLLVGGEGVALQRQYEQILKSEADLKAIIAAQNAAAEKTVVEMKKLDPASGLKWDDPKTVQALHASVAALVKGQEQIRATASQAARDMPVQSGNLRVSVGMLADTEMIRGIRILESVTARDDPQAKRSALADARLTQERTARSLQEMAEHYLTFRQEWELAHMVAFVEMLAEREARLRDQSQKQIASPKAEMRASMQKRQLKVLDLVKLAQPAFVGLDERTRSVEPILADAFKDAAKTLSATSLHALLTQATDHAAAGRWNEATAQQEQAAKELAALFARLKKAQADAALKALEALKQKAKSDAEAQKELEKLKAGTTEGFVDIKNKMKLEDIIHMREAGSGKKNDPAKNPDANDYLFPDSAKGILNPPDSGKRQDFNILKLAEKPSGTPSFPKQSDREGNKITNPPIQEKFDDLVGKLLEEADEIQKKYETYNLNAAFNINEPGDIGKQAGDINSTAASAATGNMKPPTVNVGGASRAGRRGARAHGLVVGDESINRRGRDKVQEGQEKVGDQGGVIREKKSEDMQKDTSTGVGGKKVEGDNEVKFSTEDAGKWTDDIAKRLGKPQAKNFIVERKDGRLDPKVAEMLRDMTSRQEQLIERVKSIRKELRNLYLPTEHIDEVLARLMENLEALKEQPDAELFRLQSQALDQLRNTVRVFQAPTSGFQPSLPRERGLHGRVLDEPARDALPGYEEAVKRYYEKLSSR
jgi:hypothetical protein